jgi:enoyl-CoA hydratase/carnithine racemase
MDFQTILLSKEDGIATLTLNRPESLNAISRLMFDELILALEDVAHDESVKVLVLTGAGRAFCASVDIKEFAGVDGSFLSDTSISDFYEFARSHPQKVTLALRNMEKPTIAMVNGLALGDGFDWILSCDIRVGSENAKFRAGFLQMALFPITGSAWLYPRAMGINKALELLYTDDWMSAREAYEAGVLNKITSGEKLKEDTMVLAGKISKAPPIAIRLVKKHVYGGLGMSLEESLENAALAEALTLASQDHLEALAAFREKRPPVFRGV